MVEVIEVVEGSWSSAPARAVAWVCIGAVCEGKPRTANQCDDRQGHLMGPTRAGLRTFTIIPNSDASSTERMLLL